MLSKKMAFSLMSLITLLALAFVAPTAMAADPFDVTFEGRESVTYIPPPGGTGTIAGVPVVVTVKSGLPLSTANLMPTAAAFDKNGNMVADGVDTVAEQAISGATLPDPDYVGTATQRNFVFTISPGTAGSDTIVTKVVVRVGDWNSGTLDD